MFTIVLDKLDLPCLLEIWYFLVKVTCDFAKPLWSNYYEVGAIWFDEIDGLKPNMSLATDNILTGSLKLSNSTIETFTQTQSTKNNCFRCHNTLHRFPPKMNLDPLPGLSLNISHAFVNIYFWSQEQRIKKAGKAK